MTQAIVVVTHCASQDEAERIAAALVEERLVACASIGTPVRSRYRWRGAVEVNEEVPLTLKTGKECFEGVRRVIRRLHSYEVPEILALPVAEGDPDYLAWIGANLSCTPLA